MKILITDDSSTMRRILINILASAGMTDVVEAPNGKAAVETVAQGGIDLVLMDWNMPELSGYDALKALRAAGSKVPVIMVTTEGERMRVLEAIRAGASNYVIKPFKPEVVLTKIQEAMSAAG
jgi:two-component system chemotaxis response regulator CheY